MRRTPLTPWLTETDPTRPPAARCSSRARLHLARQMAVAPRTDRAAWHVRIMRISYPQAVRGREAAVGLTEGLLSDAISASGHRRTLGGSRHRGSSHRSSYSPEARFSSATSACSVRRSVA